MNSPKRRTKVKAAKAVNKTPEENIRLQKPSSIPLCPKILEPVEAIDMSDEDAEELIEAPRHVQQRIGTLKASSNCDSVNECADADICPSTSGMATPTKALRIENQGSDLDSEYGDELDEVGESNSLAGGNRDIPDDEDLDKSVREVIHAVETTMDDKVSRLDGVSTSFDWEEGFETFRGVPENFSGPPPGPLKDYDEPYDAFMDIWTEDIMRLIASETNRYAKDRFDFKKRTGTLTPGSRLHEWVDTDADEIAVLFALYMFMAIDPRTSQNEYWQGGGYLEMPKFKLIMSYRRYLLLQGSLHFVDNYSDVSQSNPLNGENRLSPRLAKLAPVINHLNLKFSNLYNLHRELSIDETLTLFKGRLFWAQTIRSKAARFGIKSYELCESSTGYLYKFDIYTGKNSNANSDNVPPSVALADKSTAVVLDLLKDLHHKGHCITMDNFYNSPSLARYLKSKGFDCLGTLRRSRKYVPLEIVNLPKNTPKGTIVARQCGDVSIVAWKDSNLVTFISTYHTDETYVGSRSGKPIVKPVCARDYNKTMGGVDLKDQKLSMYLLERKRGIKWYIKIFKRLLNVSIHNAFVMYNSSLKRRNMRLISHRQFRLKLADSLVDKHRSLLVSANVAEMRLRRDVVHVPKYNPGRKNRKRCRVCLQQGLRKEVHTQCVTCDEFLCFENCWREFHSSSKLKGQKSPERKRLRFA